MHLKSHPKFVRTELHLDAVGVQNSFHQSPLFVSQQEALLRTAPNLRSNVSSGRLPFKAISTNTLHCSNASNNSNVGSLRLKAPPVSTLRRPQGYENDAPRLYATTPDDAPPDILTVIKPGHVREKIAIFASDWPNSTRDGDHASTSIPASRHRKVAASINNALRALKAKGSWEETVSPKRRRRSGKNQNFQDQITQVMESQRHTRPLSPRSLDPAQTTGSEQHEGHALTVGEEEEEQKMSVVEMVAFLEQRANESQVESKAGLHPRRSSISIMLSGAPPSEAGGDEPEMIKVADMVAKLESECLKRKMEGPLRRTSSLRRTVRRLLLATRDQVSTPCPPSSQPGAQGAGREPLTTPPSGYLSSLSGEEVSVWRHSMETQSTPPLPEEAELPPGLLFLSHSPAPSKTIAQTDSAPPLAAPGLCPPCPRLAFSPLPSPLRPRSTPAAHSNSGCHLEKKRRRNAGPEEDAGVLTPLPAAAPVCRRASASLKFLVTRHRLRQLLEPQPYLAMLPHLLLVKIFLLLPTRSLAALKCTCHNFKVIIDTYGLRPADSLWVSDLRYRDDPCKQCKKRYRRGDVSLCRWHNKPFCQALPYGPGHWMCCQGASRDVLGCSVGLHDNRWVPAFHSMKAPTYRRNHQND
ncbi:F-box only protein 34 [Brachionichthys hirsutus]|uniref:F-box only protein 34 n=1 Tax=Brachionichthys hirsutus TaxID=412623 RepID=UPI0036043114